MNHEEVDEKRKKQILHNLIKVLTKLGSFIDAYASTCEFLKCNFGFQTLNIISMSMWIAHAVIQACWCTNATSSHSRKTAIFDVILAPLYIILSSPRSVGSMVKMVFLDGDEEPIRKVFTKYRWSAYVHYLLHVCSILKSFDMLLSNNKWWPFEFYLILNEKFDVISHLHNYPIACKGGHKGYGSNLNTITLQKIVG